MAKNLFDIDAQVNEISEGSVAPASWGMYTQNCYSTLCYSSQCYSSQCYSSQCYTGQQLCGYTYTTKC